MRKRKVCLFILSLTFSLLFLTSCRSNEGNVFDLLAHIGDSFGWFFTKLTPAYFSSLSSVWNMLSCLEGCWEIPSFIGWVLGVVMSVFVFVIVLLISAIIIIGYVILLLLFVIIFLVLIILALLGTLITAISMLILWN